MKPGPEERMRKAIREPSWYMLAGAVVGLVLARLFL